MDIKLEHPTNRPNFTLVTVGLLEIAFSYSTPIGFRHGETWQLRQNEWGPTTGRHLNWLPQGDGRRLDGSTFMAILNDKALEAIR